MPCDDEFNKDDMSPAPISDTVKEWCKDIGIPMNEQYEVIGYSYDDSIDLDSMSSGPDSIYAKHKEVGCRYGDDKKRCVYVEKRNEAGTAVIGIENKYGDNFFDIFWNDLTTHTKMSNFFKEDILKNMEIKVENNKLHIRPKPTSLNCAEFTGKWFVMKPGINIPTVLGMQMTVLFLHIKGYPKDLVTYDINVSALSKEEIERRLRFRGNEAVGKRSR